MYVDQDKYPEAKKQSNKMNRKYGIKSDVEAVDLEYGFVPTSTSQSAKGGMSNVRKAHKMNMKRFGYEK